MVVVMRAARHWQHAGQERLLAAGESYDLPDAIALQFLATGIAARVTLHETKPAPTHERKGRRA